MFEADVFFHVQYEQWYRILTNQ